MTLKIGRRQNMPCGAKEVVIGDKSDDSVMLLVCGVRSAVFINHSGK
jgi:hypothetical protein